MNDKKLVRKYADKWMRWFLNGDGSFDGHNWNSHRTPEEKNSAPNIVWNLVADAVNLLQLAIGDDKKSYNDTEWDYFHFIIDGERPERVFDRRVKYHAWHLYEVLKLTDQYEVKEL